MSAILNQCSLTRLSDGIISFIQHRFSKAEFTPQEYRWDANEEATKIFISGPFSYSRKKVGSLPSVTVSRGPFAFENRTIDNKKNENIITGESEEKVEILSGPVTIICESGSGDEAVALAQFIMLELQANRHNIKKHMQFLHRLLWVGITPEQPVKEEAEIVRWQCSFTFNASIYLGWLTRTTGLNMLGSIDIKNAEKGWESTFGSVTQGSNLLVDNSADFGTLNTNEPQMLSSELSSGWYYISFDGCKMYKIDAIVDNKTLRLDGYSAESTSNTSYGLYWNTVHLDIALPNKNN